MKLKFNLILTAILLLSTLSFSQTKELTMEDAVWNQWFSLYPEDLSQIQWKGDSYQYTYIEDWSTIYVADIKDDKPEKLLTLFDVNKKLIANGLKEIKYFNDIQWLDNDKFLQIYGDFAYIYDTKKNEIVTSFDAYEGADQMFYSKEANAIAFTNGNDLYMLDSKRKLTKVASDIEEDISFGSDYVHRQEFGIDRGIFWSPKGNLIAFYRKDESMVADYPVIDFTTFPASVANIKYPMTGQTSEEVTLGVYDISTRTIKYMKTEGPKDQYLTSITWDPTEKFIYIGVLNRDQNHLQFNKYDVYNGNFVQTLFEEKSDKYVEPEHPAIFLPKTKNQFLWYSERDGYNHLYLYDTDGKLIRQVTKGAWVVTDFYGFSENESKIYIQSTAECGIQRHIYEVDMYKGNLDILTQEHGTHNAVFTTDKKYFINKYSSTDVSNVIDVHNNKGKVESKLLISKNTLKDYKLGEMKIGMIKAADGETDLYYRLITPPDLDKTKKYPVIIYVYGGPHAQLVTDSWLGGVSLWQFYMAQRGYVMFTIDNRGSADRGRDFENVIFRQCGVEEMKDQMEGIKFLGTLPYVDENRIGVHGWSYGGFMTTSLITTYPDVFKVAVAGGPVVDWKYYEVMYGERYMDTPETNPEGFESTSLLNKIEKLKGKLLVIHGGVDPVVVPQNSMDLLLKSQQLGVQIDFYTYPNSEHNVRGRERIHLMQKVTDYFDTYL
ncbi:MAG: DPP IV N-terminal domain-containing protein [Bacteroidales bacterium]|nr:DPP IV N-terminal domain-containing protein [Bacteroidales bacterium]